MDKISSDCKTKSEEGDLHIINYEVKGNRNDSQDDNYKYF